MSDRVPLYPENFLTRTPERHLAKRRNARGVTMPKANVSPVARLFFAEMGRRNFRYLDCEELSGIRVATQKQWRRKNRMSLESAEAVLAVLGYAFVPVPSLEAMPSPELAGDLAAISLKFRLSAPETWHAMLDMHIEQRLLELCAEERAAILANHDAVTRRTANDNAPRRKRTAKAS